MRGRPGTQVAEVRLNVVANLEHADGVFGPEALQVSVLPGIEELASDTHWRVRHAVIGKLPLLARALGPDVYESRLLARHRAWLCDPVASIRDAAMQARACPGPCVLGSHLRLGSTLLDDVGIADKASMLRPCPAPWRHQALCYHIDT